MGKIIPIKKCNCKIFKPFPWKEHLILCNYCATKILLRYPNPTRKFKVDSDTESNGEEYYKRGTIANRDSKRNYNNMISTAYGESLLRGKRHLRAKIGQSVQKSRTKMLKEEI